MNGWMRGISAIFLGSSAIVFGSYAEVTGREEAGVAGRPDDKKANQGEASRVLAKSSEKSIALKASSVNITLDPVAESKGVEPKGITERVKSLKKAGLLHLVLKGLRTETPPGVLYELYIDLPDKPSAEQKRAHSVGVMSFFNFVGEEDTDTDDPSDRGVLSFDVTKTAKRLQSEGKLQDKPVLTIVPVGKPADNAKPIVGEVTLVES